MGVDRGSEYYFQGKMAILSTLLHLVKHMHSKPKGTKRGGGGVLEVPTMPAYLSVSLQWVPTRGVFRGRCHYCLICVHRVSGRGDMWGIF